MTTIKSVHARRIWDSRGRPTVEAEVTLSNGVIGRGIAPAGASRGTHEATDMRDGGGILGGLDVQNAIANVDNVIAKAITGEEVTAQEKIDRLILALDPSPNKAKLGGNATISVSLAVLHAAANTSGQPLWQYLARGKKVHLPLPQIQIFGGGAHASSRVDVQDFLVMPLGAKTFARGIEMAAQVYMAAGEIMNERNKRSGVADEGGWWPNFDTNEEALETLVQSIERAGLKPGEDIGIALDLAASEFYRDGFYVLGLEKKKLTSAEWSGILEQWLHKYPIVSMEDAFAEEDFSGMAALTDKVGKFVQLIGDDGLVTNTQRIKDYAARNYGNAVLVKPNQVGTVTETMEAMVAARTLGWGTVISARSGETEDTTITHLSTGWDAKQLKVGSIARSERLAKWNEGIRIEDDPTVHVDYIGADALTCDWRHAPWRG